MDLFDIFCEDCCTVELSGATKDDVLRELAALACRHPQVAEVGEVAVYQALHAREAQGTTGFEGGLALPHARLPGLHDFAVSIAVAPRGVEFAAIDKRKSRLFFVILGPTDRVRDHLKILAAISHRLTAPHVRNELLIAPTATALYESFLRRLSATQQYTGPQRKMKLFFIILYFEEFLYDILQYFLQEGIDGATILDSSGMGEYISTRPLFAGFVDFLQERKNHSTTILALVPEEKAEQILAGIEEITGDLEEKHGAIVIHTDVSFYKGSMKML
jgi:nitrogen PTS system EIIA component